MKIITSDFSFTEEYLGVPPSQNNIKHKPCCILCNKTFKNNHSVCKCFIKKNRTLVIKKINKDETYNIYRNIIKF